MEIKQIITVLIVSIIAGLVFVPIISGMNVTTYSIDYTDPTITYHSFQADTVVISEATNGDVWINEYEMFFDNDHPAWSLTYSAAGATATDDLFTVQGCQ